MSYYKLFWWDKKPVKNIDAMCDWACMATSRDKYYTEMFKTLTDYNNHNNTPLSNSKTQQAIRKSIKEESNADSSNITAHTFSHESNTQRYYENAIFTSEKLDKSDELVDTVKNLTINNDEYY